MENFVMGIDYASACTICAGPEFQDKLCKEHFEKVARDHEKEFGSPGDCRSCGHGGPCQWGSYILHKIAVGHSIRITKLEHVLRGTIACLPEDLRTEAVEAAKAAGLW